jgi:hypothetical protein
MSIADTGDSQKFVLEFFKRADEILEKKQVGGKKKTANAYKKGNTKQKGGMDRDAGVLLPHPLKRKRMEEVEALREIIHESPSLQSSLRVVITPTTVPEERVIDEFSNHIKSILEKVNTTAQIEMSAQDLQVLGLYVAYREMKDATAVATNQTLEAIRTIPHEAVADDKSRENLQMAGALLANVPGSRDAVSSQINALTAITRNASEDVADVIALYENNAPPATISSAINSAFVNLFGYLSALMNLLFCYKNRIKEFGSSFRTKNPVIYFIMSAIYSCMSYIISTIFWMFKGMLNTTIGTIFLMAVFGTLYARNNTIAVFIGNMMLKLLSYAGEKTGMTDFIRKRIMENIPHLLSSVALNGLLTNALSNALVNPTVLANFINSLTPELSSQIIRQSLPAISNGLNNALINASPAIVEGFAAQLAGPLQQTITAGFAEGAANMAVTAMPALIEGVTTAVTTAVTEQAVPMITEAVTTVVVEQAVPMIADAASTAVITAAANAATAAAEQQLTSALTQTAYSAASRYALGLAASAVGGYLGIDGVGEAAQALLLLKQGGKRTIKIYRKNGKQIYRRQTQKRNLR